MDFAPVLEKTERNALEKEGNWKLCKSCIAGSSLVRGVLVPKHISNTVC